MLNGRCAVIFAAACGYFRGGLRYFLRLERFCYIIVAVVFFAFCFLSLYFLRLFLHLSQFIFAPVWVYFYTCLSLFSHLSKFIFPPVSFYFSTCLCFLFRLFWADKQISSVWSFDFLSKEKRYFRGETSTCSAKKPTGKGEKKTTCDYELNGMRDEK